MELIYLFIGLLLGGFIVWLLMKLAGSGNKNSSEKITYLSSEIENYKKEIEQKSGSIIELSKELSAKNADFDNLTEKLAEQKEEIYKLNEKFAIEFKNLANEILDEKTKKFTEQNKINLSEVLNPFKEKITDFEKKVEQVNKENIDRNAALRQQILGLKELNMQITKEAENLTKALKGDSKSQGNWGEFILESILEKSGLDKGREFRVQQSSTIENGKRLQPDVIINLPEKKHIIIDSKVSLVAYEKYVNETTDEEREKHLKNHILSIRAHIKNLSEKNYTQIYDVRGLDFILLFMPIEPAFSLAVQNEEQLFNEAYEKNIVIVGPSTLIATLKTIASIWRQEYQNKNVEEIAQRAGALYDHFTRFIDDLVKLGKKLDDAQDSYKSSMNKIVNGKGSLVSRVENLKKLGAKAKKSLPDNLLDRAIDK
ncbi:DNA recombination protein RmuC [Bacteroidota bacterium]